MTPEDLIGLLAEPRRRKVFAALVLGARTPQHIAQLAGLGERDVAAALGRLTAGGLAERTDDGIRLREELLGTLARQTAQRQRDTGETNNDHGYDDPRIGAVVATFIADGRLLALPAQHSRRALVLQHVAQTFEPGVHYGEADVNVVLRAWCADGPVDHVTLRRNLVDHGLLSREDGRYWRSGGWVDVLG